MLLMVPHRWKVIQEEAIRSLIFVCVLNYSLKIDETNGIF